MTTIRQVQKPALGFLGCLILCVGGAIAQPLAVPLKECFSAAHLISYRGVALMVAGGCTLRATQFRLTDRYLLPHVLCSATSGLTYLVAAQAWGVGRASVLGASSPLFVVVVALCMGRRITPVYLLPILAIVVGAVGIASHNSATVSAADVTVGLWFSMISALFGAVGWELGGHTTASMSQRIFWTGVAGVLLGVVGGTFLPHGALVALTLNWALFALFFALMSGPFRFVGISAMCMHLPQEVVSALAQLESLAILLVALQFHNEQQGMVERLSSALILLGAVVIAFLVRRTPRPD